MKINRKIIIATIVGITLATGIGIYAYVQNKTKESTTNSAARETKLSVTTGSATYKQYSALKGEAYDRAFLSGMIIHHGSAMDMSELAGASTKRQEILDLAMSINTTQSSEMMEMIDLQTQNGYPVTNGHDMSNMEGGANTAESMDTMMIMMEELQELKDEEFDKKFLSAMIAHHQDAIDMSKPAATNAASPDIKRIANGIISAQQAEIDQMKQWQIEWGFTSS